MLALWLTRLGIHVRILDKAAEPGTTSRALAVQARTLELYGQIGIADRVIEGGVQVAALNLWVEGRRAARVPIRRMGEGLSPYPFPLVYPQDDHERLLIEELHASGVRVERRTELIGLDQSDSGVRAMLRRPDGSEEICEATYLAACDGASSAVREALHIGFPGGTYEGIFYVADVEAAGPPIDGELHIDLEDADFVLLFPMKEHGRVLTKYRRVRLVGSIRETPSRDPGAETFDDVGDRAIESLKLDLGKVNWFSTYRVHHRVALRFRAGRVFLLGDAAHIHSPAGGQGMNTGIGDAVNLAWKLAAVLKGQAAERLLETYEPERIRFARRLVATTDRVFTLVTKRGALARFVRTRLVPLFMPLVFRLPFMRRFFFLTVSQIGVDYRESPLSAASAGRIRAGDRLPWVEIGPSRDNFAPLDSLDWQVHVYGEPRPQMIEACAGLGIAVHGFPWKSEMRRAGIRRSACYLVRPDGYVALADPEADPRRLRRYFEEWGLQGCGG